MHLSLALPALCLIAFIPYSEACAASGICGLQPYCYVTNSPPTVAINSQPMPIPVADVPLAMVVANTDATVCVPLAATPSVPNVHVGVPLYVPWSGPVPLLDVI
uniref:Secreted protein n=1 Tax=Panagrellus redivivus TaxID=6233 RepID=A0A7E4ZR62_PANRE